MTNAEILFNGQKISYMIFEDGYEIYLDNKLWISQRNEHSKPIDKDLSFEENCLTQIEKLTFIPEEPNNDYSVSNDIYNQIIDDYTLLLVESGIL